MSSLDGGAGGGTHALPPASSALPGGLLSIRATWLAEAEIIRNSIEIGQERLAEIKRRVAALDVVLAAIPESQGPVSSVSSERTPAAPNVRSLGRSIVGWAEQIIRLEGPTTSDDLYVRLPPEYRQPFDKGGALDGAFRLRRLFRRDARFKVRRGDGLVALGHAAQAGSLQGDDDAKTPRLLVAILISADDGTPVGFLVAGEGQPATATFDEVRRQIASGVRYAVRGREGRLSTVEIRNQGFRSVHDGVPNDDVAALQKIEREDQKK